MNGSSTEPPPDSEAPRQPGQTKGAPLDAARELESRRRGPADRTSEEQPDSSAYRIERQAILLRRQRWIEAERLGEGRATSRPRGASIRPPDPGDRSSLWQFERPDSPPESDSGLGGWVRDMWRRWTS